MVRMKMLGRLGLLAIGMGVGMGVQGATVTYVYDPANTVGFTLTDRGFNYYIDELVMTITNTGPGALFIFNGFGAPGWDWIIPETQAMWGGFGLPPGGVYHGPVMRCGGCLDGSEITPLSVAFGDATGMHIQVVFPFGPYATFYTSENRDNIPPGPTVPEVGGGVMGLTGLMGLGIGLGVRGWKSSPSRPV